MNYAHVVLLSVLSCTACTDHSSSGPKTDAYGAPLATTADNLLPMPTGPLELSGVEDKQNRPPMSVEEMIAEMERITPVRFVVNQETQAMMGRISVGNLQRIVVPPAEAWTVFESILCELEFNLSFVSNGTPPILSVSSSMPMGGRGSATAKAVEVAVADIPRWRAHPAFTIATNLELPDVNVRDLSNSLRQMLTDPSSQQIIPIGNTNTLMIIGRSGAVVPLVKMLQGIDASGRKHREREAQREQEKREQVDKGATPK